MESLNHQLVSFILIIHSKTKEEVIIELKNQIKKTKEIQNTVKRNIVMTKLIKLIDNVQSDPNEIINNIIIYKNNDDIIKYPINKNYCLEWNIPVYQFRYSDDNLDDNLIDFCIDLFYNKDYKHAIFFDKKYIHYIGTKYKRKVIKEYSSVNDLAIINNNFVLYGKTKVINHPKIISFINNNLKWTEVIKEHEKWEMKQIHRKLNDTLLLMSNPKTCDTLIYKSEIEKAIEDYRIKELYLMEDYKINIPSDMNFKIYRVFSIDRGDTADILQNKYDGIIGVSYY
jgi:hypothetical protein